MGYEEEGGGNSVDTIDDLVHILVKSRNIALSSADILSNIIMVDGELSGFIHC